MKSQNKQDKTVKRECLRRGIEKEAYCMEVKMIEEG
jgi:hypothetical protein